MKKNKKHYDKYKKFDVVYADFGRNPHGVQGGIRPGIVVSCDASNHGGAPQISVVPLSNLGNGWGYEMTPAELAKKDEFYSIYWSEYNLVKESGSPELYDKIHNRNNYADI